MKKLIAALAALFAASAFAQSTMATKTYVDRKYNEAISNAVPKESDKVEIGIGASAPSIGNVSVGPHTSASGVGATAVGNYAEAKGSYTTAVGVDSHATNTSATAVGCRANAGNAGTALGNATTAGPSGVAVGNGANASGQSGIAIGSGSVASGNQSFAIGRDAKATHTASGAIGPMAETDRDGSLRIKYGIDEIFLGFWYPKSLGDYMREMAPAPDESLIRNLAKDEVSKAKHLPMEDFYTQGSTTVKVFKTTRTVTPMLSRYPYTAKYKIEGLTPEETGKASGGEYTLTFGTNAIMCFENGGSIQFKNGAFWAIGSGNDIFIQNPTNVIFYGAALNRENSKTLPQWIDDKMATAGSVKKVANKSPDASGNVPLTAADVGALPVDGIAQEAEFANRAGSVYWVDVSAAPWWIQDDYAEVANEANYANEAESVSWGGVTEKPLWIGDEKPTYTASEVGAVGYDPTAEEPLDTAEKILAKAKGASEVSYVIEDRGTGFSYRIVATNGVLFAEKVENAQ